LFEDKVASTQIQAEFARAASVFQAHGGMARAAEVQDRDKVMNGIGNMFSNAAPLIGDSMRMTGCEVRPVLFGKQFLESCQSHTEGFSAY
jgi:hypothetical protein